MSKWIVIGGSSFSGQAFCSAMIYQGHTVVATSRKSLDLGSAALQDHAVAICERNPDTDYVVNFAALNMVAESWAHYKDYYHVNVVGVAQVARVCQALLPNLRKFVQVSTPEVYGAAPAMSNPMTEYQPYCPSTPYAVSRAAADMDLAALHRATGFPVCFTRTVNVFGIGQQPYRVIPKTVLKILRGEKLKLEGGGESERSFIHIDDVARGIQAVAERGAAGEIYHMSGAPAVRIRVLIGRICAHMGRKFDDVVEVVPDRLGKDKAYHLNDHKIRTVLKWRPEFRATVLEDVVAWYVAHAEDYKNDSLEYKHAN